MLRKSLAGMRCYVPLLCEYIRPVIPGQLPRLLKIPDSKIGISGFGSLWQGGYVDIIFANRFRIFMQKTFKDRIVAFLPGISTTVNFVYSF